MSFRACIRIAFCSALLLSFAGCPNGVNVVGWWAVTQSPGDTNSLLLYADGSADYVTKFDDFEGGAWSVSGNEITVTFVLPNDNFQKTFEGAISGNSITGTWIEGSPNIGSGSWTATKIIP